MSLSVKPADRTSDPVALNPRAAGEVRAAKAVPRSSSLQAVVRLIRADLAVCREGCPPGWRGVAHVWLFNACFRAVALYRFAHVCRERRWLFLARWLTVRSRIRYGVEISPLATIGQRFRVAHGVGTVIGGTSRIGDDCIVFQQVTLGTIAPGRSTDVRYPVLGDRVTVYAGAKVLGGVTIGTGAVIAANAVVTKDVPAHALVGGIPARVLHMLDETRAAGALL